MKKKILSVLSAAILAGLFLSCTRNIPANNAMDAPPKAAMPFGIKYARNFNIDYMANGIKLVTDSDKNKLLLVPKGVSVPSGHNDAVLVETPVTNAMYTSTTYIGLLGALEDDSLYNSVTAVCTPLEDWTTPQIIQRFKSGKTHFIDHSQVTVGNIEEIVKINPGFVFTGGNDIPDMQLRILLDEVNIKHTTVFEWKEEGDFASLEWIKFFAAFFNLDKEADRIFETKLVELNELYGIAANISVKPTVAYGFIWRGSVFTQSGGSVFDRQIERAGGIYALKGLEGSGNITITMEEFLNRCRDTDIFIYGSMLQYCPDKSFLLETEPLIAEFSAFKNDKIYLFDQGYYMNNAKVVEKFKDMIFLFHPDVFPGHELLFYRKLPD